MSDSVDFVYATPGVDENTQFYIGAISTNMTAYMLLMTLREVYPQEEWEKLLQVPLPQLFPKSPFLKKLGKSWINEITLLDLLTHRSGLSNYLEAYGDEFALAKGWNHPMDPVTLLQSISFDRAKKELYSNSNYLLLGKLIEEMQGESFDLVFARLIQTPARMRSSFAPIAGNYFAFQQQARFSRLAPDRDPIVCLDMSNALGAGNVISTVADLKRWAHYLLDEAPREIVDLMLKDYGRDADGEIINLGFGTVDTCSGPFVGHQGSLDSYATFFGFFLESRLLVIACSNKESDFEQVMEILVDQITTTH
ncbi:MAG: serine hydrolase domain-containing protein [Chlamydiota bacterium]